MRKIWLIVKREYLTRVRTKAFILGTIALPLLSVGIFAVEIITALQQSDHTRRLAVLDQEGGIAALITSNLKEKLKSGVPAYSVVETLEKPASETAERDRLSSEVRSHKLDGYILVPADATGNGAAEFHTRNVGDMAMTGYINQVISDAVIAERLKDRGVAVADVGKLTQGVDLKLVKVNPQGESEEEGGQTFITALILGMLLYVSLVIYGVATMRSVMEEKTTRVVEVLVASVRPFQLLFGKIIGVAGVALTQYLIWTVVGGAVAAYGSAMAAASPGARMPKIHLPPSLLVYLVVFFLAGYLLYSSLYAAVGSMVSTDQEAQQLQAPLTMLIVLSFVLFNIILKDPSSRTSVVLSIIPFISPILMILRIAMQTPPFWQIALSLGLSLLTTVGVVYVSARIYRVGVLMYGKRPSLVELGRWLRYT